MFFSANFHFCLAAACGILKVIFDKQTFHYSTNDESPAFLSDSVAEYLIYFPLQRILGRFEFTIVRRRVERGCFFWAANKVLQINDTD